MRIRAAAVALLVVVAFLPACTGASATVESVAKGLSVTLPAGSSLKIRASSPHSDA